MFSASPPTACGHLRVPFIFVPDGTPDPADVAQFKADHPGGVRFRASFRPRPGSSPLVTTIPPMPVLEAQRRPQETVRDPWPRPTGARLHGARSHGTRLAVPRIVEPWRPPPRLPAHSSPLPATYTGPQSLTGAFVGSMAKAAGRAALIRSAQMTLDTLARRDRTRPTERKFDPDQVLPTAPASTTDGAALTFQKLTTIQTT